MGETLKIIFSYTELMTMLYPDYIFIRNILASKYEKLREEMEKSKYG